MKHLEHSYVLALCKASRPQLPGQATPKDRQCWVFNNAVAVPHQVDVLPIGPGGAKVAAVNYFRDVATFLEAPVSPVGPASS